MTVHPTRALRNAVIFCVLTMLAWSTTAAQSRSQAGRSMTLRHAGHPPGVSMAATPGMTYYLAPDGSDADSGGPDAPWQTLAHALEQLAPGDVLNLRDGVHYIGELDVTLRGTPDAPITIRSLPGERARIDGGVADFRTVPNDEWALVDGAIGLYRSRRTFAPEDDFVRAWLPDDDLQLVEYNSAANLESTNVGPMDGLAPIYIGPGIQLRDDGHLYIRLMPNPHDLTGPDGAPVAPTPRNPDPNQNRLAVFFTETLLTLEEVAHLHLEDLDFAYAHTIMDVRGASNHVRLSGCRLNYGTRGLLFRDPVQDWEISGCEFNNGVPGYIYWTDVKNRGTDVTEAYPEFQSSAVKGTLRDSSLHHNLFRNGFDGLTVEEDSRNVRIAHNLFRGLRDDSINLSKGIGPVEVAHNLFWHVMGGIANLSSDAAPGPVYIHHNILDNSAFQRGGRPGNDREENWPVWTIGSPFPGHDDGDKAAWWRLYNNTIVTRQDRGHRWSPAGPDEVTDNPEKYVLNNIFYVLDQRVIFRDAPASSGAHYDGNLFYRGGPADLPLFTDFGDGGRYDSLREFRREAGVAWECHGLELDPGFHRAALADPTFDPDAMWARYRPKAAPAYTPGASYAGLDWPDTAGVTYRGAVPGVPAQSLYLPSIGVDRTQSPIDDPVASRSSPCAETER